MADTKTSSIAYKDVKKPENDQFTLGTWTGVLPLLIIAFILLKVFVYIKDDKRHGK